MEQNVINVINSLGESDILYYVGEVDLSEIEQAEETLGVEFADDFVEYVQNFGSISVGSIELCGIDEDPDCSTVDKTEEMRDQFSDFPMDCYVIESVGIDDAVMVQKTDGKIYQFLPEHELMFVADSLSAERKVFKLTSELPYEDILKRFLKSAKLEHSSIPFQT